jgi:hypothetical protein
VARKQGGFFPGSGGIRIPETEKRRTEARICGYAAQHFAGCYARLDIHFRGQFCYIDAYVEPEPPAPDWPPPGWPESREQYIERLRKTPVHLCRLRYFGHGDGWGFAFYTYSNECYELSIFPSGEFFGTPEDAFDTAAQAYLGVAT